MALTQETKPKMKNNNPIMRIEILVSRLVNEPTGMAGMLLFITLTTKHFSIPYWLA